MYRYCIILYMVMASALFAMGQDFRLLSVSDGSYPEIRIRAKIARPGADSITILDNGVPVPYTIQESEPSAKPGDGRMYVFLVENSYSFHHRGITPVIKGALSNLQEYIHGADNANILLFGMPGANVRYMSAEQTSDLPLLSQIVQASMTEQDDSTYFDNNLILALEEAQEYCRRHQKPQQTTVLFVIARALNLSSTRQFAPEFKERLAKSGTYLNLIMLDTESQNIKRELEELAQSTGGGISLFQKNNLEGVLAQQIERMAKSQSKNTAKEVTITFLARQEGVSNSFTIQHGDAIYQGEYTNPRKSGFLGKYPIAVSIMIGLLVAMAALIFYIRTRNRIIRHIDSTTQTHFRDLQRQNRQLRQEIEKYKRNPLSLAHSFDNIYIEETLIGSGKIVPKLVVDDRKTQLVFKLNKFTMTLGRGEGCDIVIENRTVSSHHATLTNEGGLFYITDNDSTNGTFVNDIRITKSKIQPKDRIRIGAIMATLVY